jgi:heme/copper-type cytochrome/quinol oxidase subunit 3
MSDVTHSYDAESNVAIRATERRARAFPNGWWGMALLIATEATLFGTMIATYFYLRFQVVDWPPLNIEPPKVALPLALTGALVATSIPMFLAARSARRGRPGLAVAWLVPALLVQCGYLAVQIVLYLDDLSKFSPQGTAYGSIYFTLLMTHHVHVLVGILLNVWIVYRLLGGLTEYRVTGMRAIAIYWHFVNIAAVAVVLTQVSPSL